MIAIVIAVNHFRSEEPRDEVVSRVASLASKSIEERGGWSAKAGAPGATSDDNRGAEGASSVSGASSRSSGDRSGAGGISASGDQHGNGPTVITNAHRAGGSVGFSGSSAPVAGGSTIRLGAPRPAVKFEGAGTAGGGSDGRMVVASAGTGQAGVVDPNKPAEDPNEPVLSLPLDHTAEPEKGVAPLDAQGITFESGSGAKFAADAQFIVPDAGGLTGEAGTVSFNLQNEWTGNDSTDASLLKIRNPNDWSDRIEITKNGQYLRMALFDDAGNESGVSTAINWQPGEQHQISASWGDGVVTMSVDGRQVGQGTYPGTVNFRSGTPMFVGSDVPGGQGGARGTLSDIKVYNTKQ